MIAATAKPGESWGTGSPGQTKEVLEQVAALLSAASEKAVGETASWELLRLARLQVEGMTRELFDRDLDNGHMADSAASLQALIAGAQAVADATPEAAAHIRGALSSTNALWQHLGYSDPTARKGPQP